MSNRGLGEKKIELDKRHIERRLAELRRELKQIERERNTQRSRRLASGIFKVALVGYTNSGKSTLLNRFLEMSTEEYSDKAVFAEDMLFATLDTMVRKIAPEGYRPFLLSDTVGFIDELPHTLVKAFRSTLEEVRYADLLLEIVDCSDSEFRSHLTVTDRTLAQIGAGSIPRITVYNKADRAGIEHYPVLRNGGIFISAAERVGLKELLELIEAERSRDEVEVKLLIPYRDMAVLDHMNRNATILHTEYTEDGTRIEARCRRADADKYRKFCTY